MKEFIICAAIHVNDGKEHKQQPNNIYKGFVVCGRRHNNCIHTLAILNATHLVKHPSTRQGFLTNTDRFVERQEAMEIARIANQLLDPKTRGVILTSEDLY